MANYIKDLYGGKLLVNQALKDEVKKSISFWSKMSKKKGFKTMAKKDLRYFRDIQKKINGKKFI